MNVALIGMVGLVATSLGLLKILKTMFDRVDASLNAANAEAAKLRRSWLS